MDEFLQGAFSIIIPDGFYRGYDPVKSVLYAYVFEVARRLTHDAASLMIAARLEGLGLALAGLCLVGWISRRLGRTTREALFAVAVLLSFSNFMERSFRVRSDSVAVFFIVTSMTAATWAGSVAAAVSGLLAGAAFLSTQKAAFAVLGLGLGWACGMTRSGARVRAFGEAVAFCGGFAAAVLAYGAWFGAGGPGALVVVKMVFLSPLDFAAHGRSYYDGLEVYVAQTLGRNVLAWSLCAAGLILAAVRVRALSDAERRLFAVAAVVTPFVFFGAQTWPYAFVMPMVALAIFAPEVPRAVAAWAPSRTAAALVALLAGLAFSFPRNVRYLRVSNADQLDTVREIEGLLEPEDRYLDGTWMIATRRHAGKIWWDGPALRAIAESAARGDTSELDRAFGERPKVVVLNYRTMGIGPFLARYVIGSYVRVAPNALLAGVQLQGGGDTLFENRWPGRYRLVDAKGRPWNAGFRLDGRAVSGDVGVSPGSHRVSLLEPGASGYLLAVVPHLPGPLPVTKPPVDLFGGVYD